MKHLTFFTSALDTAEVGTGWHAKIVQQIELFGSKLVSEAHRASSQ